MRQRHSSPTALCLAVVVVVVAMLPSLAAAFCHRDPSDALTPMGPPVWDDHLRPKPAATRAAASDASFGDDPAVPGVNRGFTADLTDVELHDLAGQRADVEAAEVEELAIDEPGASTPCPELPHVEAVTWTPSSPIWPRGHR